MDARFARDCSGGSRPMTFQEPQSTFRRAPTERRHEPPASHQNLSTPTAQECTSNSFAFSEGRDRQSIGDWQFEEIWRPKRQISSNCQSPVVCLSPCRSIREYIPRFLLDPGIHSEVLPCSRGPNAGFASVGPKTPLWPQACINRLASTALGLQAG